MVRGLKKFERGVPDVGLPLRRLAILAPILALGKQRDLAKGAGRKGAGPKGADH